MMNFLGGALFLVGNFIKIAYWPIALGGGIGLIAYHRGYDRGYTNGVRTERRRHESA